MKEGLASAAEVNNVGISALHYAVLGGYVKIATMLIKSGADVMLLDDLRRRPIHLAPSLEFERELRAAEKKRKAVLQPVEPPGRAAAREAELRATAPPPAAAVVPKAQPRERVLVEPPTQRDPTKADSGAVTWSSLQVATHPSQYATEAFDVIYVYVGLGARKAVVYPIKVQCGEGKDDCR